jgi:sphingomyelin phosphodiesterase acid-like 3
MFLGDEKLVEALTDFSADIRLAIFAHTHSDEMRLLQRPVAAGAKPAWVAAKLVPSVTPINGNNPAFTVAEVDPRTAVLKDYRVIVADSKTGIGAKWHEEYRYSTTYKRPAFSADAIAPLFADFAADKDSKTPQSQSYMLNFMPGGGLRSMAMRLVWPQYVCSMEHDTEAGYRACACPAKP